MSAERLVSREPNNTAEGLLDNPPKLILVFDNYRGPKPIQKELAEQTMAVRAFVAALIYHSTLYESDTERPTVCSFAGEHEPGAVPGSEEVRNHLLTFEIPPDKITTRQTTITTTTDMMQLHSLSKELRIKGPMAIVTTDDHVKRTEQELVNHFSSHRDKTNVPQIYIVGPSSKELSQLEIPNFLNDSSRGEIMTIVRSGRLDHGLVEKIAYLISANPALRRYVQPLAERLSHPYTPPKLDRITKISKLFKQPK